MIAATVLAQAPLPSVAAISDEARRLVAASGAQALPAIEARLEEAMGRFDLTEACHLWSLWLAAKQMLEQPSA